MEKSKIKEYIILALIFAALLAIPFLAQTVPINGS
jgi:hypothetical protein